MLLCAGQCSIFWARPKDCPRAPPRKPQEAPGSPRSRTPYGSIWSHMAPCGLSWARWSHMAPNEPRWSQLAPYGHIWSHMVPDGPRRLQMAPYGFIGSHLVPYGPIWPQMVPLGPPYMVPYGPISVIGSTSTTSPCNRSLGSHAAWVKPAKKNALYQMRRTSLTLCVQVAWYRR